MTTAPACPSPTHVDFARVMERRAKVIKTLPAASRPVQEEQDRVHRGPRLRHRRRQRQGRRQLDGSEIEATSRHPRHRLGPKPLPGTEFGGRVIGTEEAWASRTCRDDRGHRRRRVGRGDRLRLRPPRLEGAAVRGARASSRRGPRHLEDRRPRARQAELTIHTGTKVENVESSDDKVSFKYGDETAEVDWFVIAAGRGPRTSRASGSRRRASSSTTKA